MIRKSPQMPLKYGNFYIVAALARYSDSKFDCATLVFVKENRSRIYI